MHILQVIFYNFFIIFLFYPKNENNNFLDKVFQKYENIKSYQDSCIWTKEFLLENEITLNTESMKEKGKIIFSFLKNNQFVNFKEKIAGEFELPIFIIEGNENDGYFHYFQNKTRKTMQKNQIFMYARNYSTILYFLIEKQRKVFNKNDFIFIGKENINGEICHHFKHTKKIKISSELIKDTTRQDLRDNPIAQEMIKIISSNTENTIHTDYWFSETTFLIRKNIIKKISSQKTSIQTIDFFPKAE